MKGSRELHHCLPYIKLNKEEYRKRQSQMMKDMDELVRNLYSRDEYLIKNPSLHEEDSPWKVTKIIPLVDRFISYISKNEVNLLDAGGGAGLILNAVSIYVEQSHGIKVNKFALDTSPGMLEIQKRNNPDLRRALNEDIRKTSLGNKEIDLTLMIDLLEHVPNPREALQEVKRISNFAILKVPLEDTVSARAWNFAKGGKPRQDSIKTLGHINIYNFSQLKRQIENHTGQVIDFYFADEFDYWRNSEHYRNKRKTARRLRDFIAVYVFRLSPKLCSLIFTDSVMILVKCAS